MLFSSGPQKNADEPAVEDAADDLLRDRSIGEILGSAKGWTAAQIDSVIAYQRQHHLRFGDAAVATGAARPDEVMWALSQQFHYHYKPTPGVHMHDELVMANHPFSDEVEAFRDLRSQLVMGAMATRSAHRALAVVSADVGDGKTFVAANLAVAFSQLPGHTLLIDADMRSPRLHKVFGLDSGAAGLSGILSGRSEASVIRPVSELPNLSVLPVGAVPPNPLELLQRAAFGLLLDELTGKFDHVLVDTPAAAHGSDARVIAAACGLTLVVGRKNHTHTAALQSLMDHLTRGPATVAGILMNDY